MSDKEIRKQAEALASSCTSLAITEHLNIWKNIEEGHSQYDMRADQIKIATMALGL